jgi:hypothetical protein
MDKPIAEGVRAAFETWMRDVAKIVVGSRDPYPAELERQYWRVWQAATAAQQPIREGGGEVVCPYRTSCACIGACSFGLPGNGATAPPSAPVGVDEVRKARAIIDHVIHGEPGHELSAAHDLLTAALAQQPAQAAPGDRRHVYEQSGEHGGCSVCGYPSHERLLHTPPGDDAAGGGR